MNEAPPPPPPSPSPSRINDIPPPLATSAYRDRRVGLILFGILELLLGALCFLLTGLMVLGQAMLAHHTGAPVNLRMLMPGVFFYTGVGVVFVWLAVGSIQCRRWARALLLILAWVWLCTGVVTVPLMAWLMPRIFASTPAGAQPLPAGTLAVVVVVQLVFMSLFFILLPGALVLFYRSPHVRATCEARDPVRRWTDGCPLPVLGVVCSMGWGAVFMLGLPLAKLAMLPCFGILLTGLPATLLMIGLAGGLFWVGRSWYRLQLAGWWALLALLVIFGASNALTFARVEMVEVYQRLGYPQAQIDLIRQQGWMTKSFMTWGSLIWILPALGYLVWVKRFFRASPATPAPSPEPEATGGDGKSVANPRG